MVNEPIGQEQAGGDALAAKRAMADLYGRRRLGHIRDDELIRAITCGRTPDVVVLGVHADWERNCVQVMLAHPEWPPVAPGAYPPDVDVTLARELRVIDGKVWERSVLTVDEALAEGTQPE